MALDRAVDGSDMSGCVVHPVSDTPHSTIASVFIVVLRIDTPVKEMLLFYIPSVNCRRVLVYVAIGV